MKINHFIIIILIFLIGCSKKEAPAPVEPEVFFVSSFSINEKNENRPNLFFDVAGKPTFRISFSSPVDKNSIKNNIRIINRAGADVATTMSFDNNDKSILIKPDQNFEPLSKYTFAITEGIQSAKKTSLSDMKVYSIITAIDSSDKFQRISDDELLTLIQKQTFKYFWDFGHPVSGMARERNNSGDLVTTGGTCFGVMSIIVGIERNFITHSEGLARINKIVDFLQKKCTRYHGAFAHWVNGATGATLPFSTKDNAADLVETSLLMQGLLTARQYFKGNSPEETVLRNNINELWNAVEWDWFRKGDQQVLYWHWSPEYNFEMNLHIKGWNESLITYVLAASSPTHTIPKSVYDAGWASNGNMKNGKTFFDTKLPLGPDLGGPLFFAHYSFLGINPNGLSDVYANYFEQNKAHTLINYKYSLNNVGRYNGYSKNIWGLTASDDNIKGYMAHSPTNDNGVVSPTAAISSMPYTPQESMDALKFYYYTLGDKLFKEYGFVDAFNLSDAWFANSFLAIDQGPQIIMIENYRTGLLWNLFMSSPEIKDGLKKLGFQSPFI
ncbi:MAG: glucoamylase family protein [Ginsengibacter sp.]